MSAPSSSSADSSSAAGASSSSAAGASSSSAAGADQSELFDRLRAAGYLLLPAAAEPHAHLDKALTADRVANPAGDLMGAVEAWLAHRPSITVDDYAKRAERAVLMSLANGVTAVRSHVDVGADIGTTAVEGLLRVKAKLADRVDIQLVGLVGRPTAGPEGAENRAVLRDALDMGLDVVGGCPHLDEDPAGCTEATLELAAEFRRPIDLHTDETLDPSHLDLEVLADRVLATGFEPAVTASHCVSLSMQPEVVQRRVAEKVAAAGISIVALPQTNLFLQARNQRVAPPRGLTALAALDEAGANVCAGADNLQDPFCAVGRADPMETAALMVMAGHDTPEAAYRRVSEQSRTAMGLGPTDDVLAIRAGTLREAVASASADRIVIRGGQIVHGTEPSGLT